VIYAFFVFCVCGGETPPEQEGGRNAKQILSRHERRNEMTDTEQMQDAEEMLTEKELEKESGVLEADMTMEQLIDFLKKNPDCPVTIVPMRKGEANG
jgi:hypothetical protein